MMSHLGRPKGKPVGKYSLRSVATRLQEMIGQPVLFSPDCIGKEAEDVRCSDAGRRSSPAGERPFPSRRRKERSIIRPGFGQAWRDLCQRRLRQCASRARLHGRCGAHFANCRGRFPDAKGAALSGPGIGKTGVPVRGRARRRQSLGQDHCD